MMRALYVVYALILTGAVTAYNYGGAADSNASYRGWNNSSNYSSSGGWHK